MAIDLNKLKNTLDELQGNAPKKSGNGKYFNITPGTHRLRILPAPENDQHDWYVETKTHYIKVGGQLSRVTCLRTDSHSNCPVCDKMFQYYKEGDKEAGKAIKPVNRYFFNVYDYETKEVKVLNTGKQIFEKISDFLLSEDVRDTYDTSPNGPIDVVNGYDFNLTMYEEGGFPRYEKSGFRLKSTPLADTAKEIAEIMGTMHNLSEEVSEPNYEEARRAVDMFVAHKLGNEGNMNNSNDVSDSEFNNSITKGVRV